MEIRTEELMALKIAVSVLSDGRELSDKERKWLANAETVFAAADERHEAYNRKKAAQIMARRKKC